MLHSTTFPSDDELEMSHDRKSHKQEMEKRRRARINESLSQLKSLVLHALKRDETRYSKLEKADILEMTVKYLRTVRRHDAFACGPRDPAMIAQYLSGFNECAAEITRVLSSVDGLSVEIRNRMLAHVAACVQTAQSRIEMPLLSLAYPTPLPAYPRATDRLLAVATAKDDSHAAFHTVRPTALPLTSGHMSSSSPRTLFSNRSDYSSVSSTLSGSVHSSPAKTCSPSPSSPAREVPSSPARELLSSPVREVASSPGQRSSPSGDEDGRESPVWRPW